ncbi:hypothetical protein D7D52_06405 [Nocardia yunnanensis]|uniref:Uncharacterized protein n=1 Tax=Nocardia yunnanensis TaxID=2382165 RepID=A0A386Z8M6_9NOCA|nr:hypothetical protein [Nocardia yunnanensis]AYF73547.1 hypothetical protein D7D52_06405 [Nocardia yunnanensis]
MRVVLFGVGVVMAAVGVAAGAGAAAAGVPIVQIDQGRVGMLLSHDETVAVADGPTPAVVSMFVPLSRMGAGLQPDTRITKDEKGGVHASLRQVIMEAGDHPDGNVLIYVNAPGTRGGRVLDVYQNWG